MPIKELPRDKSYVPPVLSVSGRVGDVILARADVGLNNVDNTADTNKLVSTAQQSAIDLKMTQHLAAVDPHPQYTTPAEATAASPVQSVNGQVGEVMLSIPAAQVNTDWNSIGGVSQLLNKPALFSGAYTDLTGKPVLFSGNYADLTGKPTLFDGTWTSLTGKPTNISSFTNDSGYLTSVSLAGLRKTETFLGTTDASGNFTITFANTYATAPDVQPQIIGGTFNQMVRVVSVSTTGCVVQAAQRNLVTLLAVEVLLGATVNLVGASVSVQVTARA